MEDRTCGESAASDRRAESRSKAQMRRHPSRKADTLDSRVYVMVSQHEMPKSAAGAADLANRMALWTHAAMLVAR